jgi:hypothetical protein
VRRQQLPTPNGHAAIEDNHAFNARFNHGRRFQFSNARGNRAIGDEGGTSPIFTC